MKNKVYVAVIMLVVVLISLMCFLTSCGNKDIFDTEYTFTKAIVTLPDGTVETYNIKSWTDYADSDMVQFKTSDGKVYLTHSSNVLLVGDD